METFRRLGIIRGTGIAVLQSRALQNGRAYTPSQARAAEKLIVDECCNQYNSLLVATASLHSIASVSGARNAAIMYRICAYIINVRLPCTAARARNCTGLRLLL